MNEFGNHCSSELRRNFGSTESLTGCILNEPTRSFGLNRR